MVRDSLAVLVVVAEKGSLDDYIFYFAGKIKELARTLVITVNGMLKEQYLDRIASCCDAVFVRENRGYDSGAFKDTLETFLGWENVFQYKELMLINDSCYGPVYPLTEMFDIMDQKGFDFWGITEQTPIKRSYYGTAMYPYHIQTYFVVIKQDMLHSEGFKKFWSDLQIPGCYSEAVEYFELRFTSYFNSLGYLSGSYIDCESFCRSENETQAYVFMDSLRLVSEYRCPLIKKKVFSFPHELVLASNMGETAARTLAYISENTEYHIDLIWKHLIRRYDINDIRTSLHLDFCLSTKYMTQEFHSKRVLCVVICLESESIDKYASYIGGLPEYIDVVICAHREANLERLKTLGDKHRLKVKKYMHLTDMNIAELSEIGQYEYLCVINNSKRNEPYSDQICGNLVANEFYINNILDTFEREKRLGFLSPPDLHTEYRFGAVSDKLCSNYIVQMCDVLELNCNVNEHKLPFSYGNAFWCRTDALKPLFENENWYRHLKLQPTDDIGLIGSILEKIYPYIAQSQGYYSGAVMTEEYASWYISNCCYMLSRLARNLHRDRGVQEFKNIKSVNSKLIDFCRRYKGIYIYGGGEIGYACLLYMQAKGIEVQGFIVSDKKVDTCFGGKKVYTLSELEKKPNTGIVIALSRAHVEEVERLLKDRDMSEYIVYEE